MEEGFYLYNKTFKKELPKDEQNALLFLASQGDKNARDILFEHNLRLVAKILIQHYHLRTKDEQEELFSVGAEGLLKALNNFDPSFNVEFSTYAGPKIYGEMRKFLRDYHTIKIPRPLLEFAFDIINLRNKYSNQHSGVELSISEIAKILNKSEKEINDALNAVQQVSSFYDIVYTSKDDKNLTILDITADQSFSIDENILENEKIKEIKKAMSHLSERDRKIIELSFGFNGEQKTQAEIAKETNLSQSQISRVYKKSLEKIKFFLPNSIKEEYQQAINLTTNKNNKKKNIKNNKSKTIYDIFPLYTKEEILYALSLLTEGEKRIILSCYPKNKDAAGIKNNKQIAKELSIGYNNLYHHKNHIIKKLNKILYEKKFNMNSTKSETENTVLEQNQCITNNIITDTKITQDHTHNFEQNIQQKKLIKKKSL